MGPFKEGQVLTKPSDMVAYHRALLDFEAPGTSKPLTDEQILAVINAHKADNADAETARNEALEEMLTAGDGNDTATNDDNADDKAGDTGDGKDKVSDDTIPAERQNDVERDAKNAASAMAGDEAMQEHIREVIKAGRTVKMGPLVVMLDLRRIYPDQAVRSAWPKPGSSWKTRPPGSNEPVDKRRILVRGKNGLKPKTVSTYDLMFAAMPVGHDLEQRITAIDQREANKAAGKPYLQVAGWKDFDYDAARDTLVGDRTQGRTLLKRAVKLDRQLIAALELRVPKDKLDENGRGNGVIVDWKKNKAGSPEDTRYGILVTDQRDGTSTRLSIDQFLGLSVAEAMDPANVAAKGGVFDAFIQSGGGEQEPETPTTTSLDSDAVVAEMGLIASWLTIEENRTTFKKRFKENADFMVSVIEFHDEVHELCNNPDTRKRYATVTEKTDDKAKVAA